MSQSLITHTHNTVFPCVSERSQYFYYAPQPISVVRSQKPAGGTVPRTNRITQVHTSRSTTQPTPITPKTKHIPTCPTTSTFPPIPSRQKPGQPAPTAIMIAPIPPRQKAGEPAPTAIMVAPDYNQSTPSMAVTDPIAQVSPRDGGEYDGVRGDGNVDSEMNLRVQIRGVFESVWDERSGLLRRRQERNAKKGLREGGVRK